MTPHDHLSWVLNSPNLIRQQNAPFPVADQPSADEINALAMLNKDLLPNHLAKTKSHFLGSYFESLWQFYLMHSNRYDLIASNLQFHYQGKTFGELDFLAYDHQRNIAVHQEIAIKFYLGTMDEKLGSRWIGPNAIDRLDLKVAHLCDKQLPLAKHPVVLKKLESLGIKSLKSEALVKGYLFQPAAQTKVATPNYINPKHLSGTWYRFHELHARLSDRQNRQTSWLKIEKGDWISSDQTFLMRADQALSQDGMTNFLDDMNNQNRAHMFATLIATKDQLTVGEKVFVVPNNWPAPHSPPAL
jgi:uncharacterized protein